MPGVSRQTISAVVDAVGMAGELGIPAVAIFPVIPLDRKTPAAEEALDPDNLCNRAVRAIKKAVPDVGVICDVALDPYTSHGHDGVMAGDRILNDETVEILCKQAVAQAEAGVDICAPSDMMDGRIGRIRDALDAAGHDGVRILSYAAKYASAILRPVPRRGRLQVQSRPGRQAHLPDGPGQRRRGDPGMRPRCGRGRRHADGEARHALSGCPLSREAGLRAADLSPIR